MNYIEIFRGLLILIPAGIVTYKLVHQKKTFRFWVAVFFSFVWQFQVGLTLLAIAVKYKIFLFYTSDLLFYGVPIDIIFGLSLMIAYIHSGLKYKNQMALNVVLYMLTIKIFAIEVNHLFFGFFLIFCSMLVTLPAHGLFKWTNKDVHIYLRSILQNINWAILLLWLFPSIVFAYTTASWSMFLEQMQEANLLVFLPMSVPAYLIINALYHFARYGNGTGFPYDAPKILVTTGVYRFISNPMQAGIVLMMLIWGMILNNALIISSSLVAVFLFIVFKKTCNGTFQLCGQDPNWLEYQQTTPKWIPFKFT